jgi:hypothetical protein
MGPHTLAYRAAVRVVVLAAAEKAANDPTFRPELADRLAELRPDVEEWQIARRPSRHWRGGVGAMAAAFCRLRHHQPDWAMDLTAARRIAGIGATR